MGKPEPLRLNDPFPHLGTDPVPVGPYISAEYFAREKEKIFKRMWLNVCRVDHLPKPGDYVVKNIAVLDASVLLVHGDDGRIRAFHNVCQHRGNQLVLDEKGCRKAFMCGYHGWVFDTRGALRDVPDQEQFYALDKADYALPQFACEVWNGFVFIHPQQNPPQTLEAFLGEMGRDLKDFPFHEMEMVGAWRTTVNVNWKAHTDAFQEGYHVAIVHRRSFPEAFAANAGSASCLLSQARIYDLHRGLSAPANPGHTPKPAEALAFRAAATISQGSAAMQNLPPGVNLGNMENWGFDVNVLFPNFFIDPANGWYFTYNFWPETENRTYWEIHLYMRRAPNLAGKVAQAYSIALLRDALLEDASTLEGTQRGLESGGIRNLTFSDQEIACRHQFVAVDALVNGQGVR